MADIDIRREHPLGLAGARAAAERMEATLCRKFDLRSRWSGNTLTFERPGLSGTLDVSARDVRLAVSLGFLLKAMKGPIERAVTQELDAVCAAPPQAPGKLAAAKAKKGSAPKKKGG